MAGPDRFTLDDALDLLDWKRRIFALYADVRAADDPAAAWSTWCAARDALFAGHPQTPLAVPARPGFDGIPCYPYDPAWRVLARVEPVAGGVEHLPTVGEATVDFRLLGRAAFAVAGVEHRLDVFWLDAYGGGIFIPVADATNGPETYGGGRYLLDTVKGADLGVADDGRLVLDFNFCFNPSCSYDERWVCPLPTAGSRLDVAVRAGERSAG